MNSLSFEQMAPRWPGWTVEFWQDRYEEQAAACAGFVRLPAIDMDRSLAEVEEWLAAELGDPSMGLCASSTFFAHRVRPSS